MILNKRITKIDKRNCPVSDLIITVDYCPNERTVEEIKSVSAYHYHSGITTDLTVHFIEHFEFELNNMVDSIDWDELYAEDEQISLECDNKLFAEILN